MNAAKAKPQGGHRGASRAVTAEHLDARRLHQRPRGDVQALLNRLEGVRETGSGRWLAKCPAHEDRSPSLSIRECADGTILVHDFAGCDAGGILAAVGLELKDLFPRPLTRESLPPKRDLIHPLDALKALAHESRIAAVVASDVAEGRNVTPEDADRVATAAGRIGAALGAVGVMS